MEYPSPISPQSRLFVTGIANGVKEDNIKSYLNYNGELEIYVYVQGTNNNGWAWVGFKSTKDARNFGNKLAQTAKEEVGGNEHASEDSGEVQAAE